MKVLKSLHEETVKSDEESLEGESTIASYSPFSDLQANLKPCYTIAKFIEVPGLLCLLSYRCVNFYSINDQSLWKEETDRFL